MRGRGIPLLLPEGGAETLERIADPRAVLAAGDLDDEFRRLGGLVGGEREIRPTDRHFVGQGVVGKRLGEAPQRGGGRHRIPGLGLGDTERIEHRRQPGRRGVVGDESLPAVERGRTIPRLPERFGEEIRHLAYLPRARIRRETLPQRPGCVAVGLDRPLLLGPGKRPAAEFKPCQSDGLKIGPAILAAPFDDAAKSGGRLWPLSFLKPAEPEIVAPLRRQRVAGMIAEERLPGLGCQIPSASILERSRGGVGRLRRRA
jgi:hypothetical protein